MQKSPEPKEIFLELSLQLNQSRNTASHQFSSFWTQHHEIKITSNFREMGPFLHSKCNFPWLVFASMLPRNSLQTSIQLQIFQYETQMELKQAKQKKPLQTHCTHAIELLGNLCNHLPRCCCMGSTDIGIGEQRDSNA